ncbi:uncharacterized protein LOC141578336 [Camelus bactrianus]|uniref:Uncharacterized protein LOC141578336 n=1 Tax=Camelus bactrianus TaxID=9837 RepID=A0AC58QPR0_CAMBA
MGPLAGSPEEREGDPETLGPAPQIRRWRRAERGTGPLSPARSLRGGGRRCRGSAPPPGTRARRCSPPPPPPGSRFPAPESRPRSPVPGPRVPEPRALPPVLRSCGSHSVCSSEQGFLSALRSVTNPTSTTLNRTVGRRNLSARRARSAPQHRARRLAPQDGRTAVGVRRPGRGGAVGLEGPCLWRIALVSQLCICALEGGGGGPKAGGRWVMGVNITPGPWGLGRLF